MSEQDRDALNQDMPHEDNAYLVEEADTSQDQRRRGVDVRVVGIGMLVVFVLCAGYIGYVSRSFVRSWPQAVLDSLSAENAAANSAAEEAVEHADHDANVEPKAALADYSWDELGRIADEIAKSGSASAAHEAASKYHLATAEGTIDGSQTKEISLTNGRKAHVQLVGIYHDDSSDGVRKAGLSFLMTDTLGTHVANTNGRNNGGWRDSEIRSWLARDGLALLPEDLSGVIKEVNKRSNNEGYSTSATCVTTTADKLWLPSWVELAGPIDRNYFYEGYEYCGDVQNVEGSQYEAFTLAGVTPASDASVLARPQASPTSWWTRTAAPSRNDYFYHVTAEGNPSERATASESLGVVAGFCL